MPAYIEIPELTKEEYIKVNESYNALIELRKYLPTANYYTTCFVYNGTVYHTDTSPSEEEGPCKLQKLYQNIGKVIKDLPIVEKTVEKPGAISEQLLLRAISAASHRYLSEEQN